MALTIKQHVAGYSIFSYYRSGYLYYIAETGLEYPVPIADTDGSSFEARIKSIGMMRWIKKHLDVVNAEATAIETTVH